MRMALLKSCGNDEGACREDISGFWSFIDSLARKRC